MTNLREAAQMALEALESSRVFVTSREKIKHPEGTDWYDERIEALRAALAQPEPEPFGYYDPDDCMFSRPDFYMNEQELIAKGLIIPLYAAPPQRVWQGLTDEEQEPVAWMFEDDEDDGHKTFRQTPPSAEAVAYLAEWNRPAWVPLYTAQPQREWQGLTAAEQIDFINGAIGLMDVICAVEAKLKEKNR